uniref:Uncharacterized protein n=1 Tax=Globodera rostochiensis TaxID=31243 RepID=A0A914GPR8_GLORO
MKERIANFSVFGTCYGKQIKRIATVDRSPPSVWVLFSGSITLINNIPVLNNRMCITLEQSLDHHNSIILITILIRLPTKF